jgi:hypothetical protein
MNEVGRVSNVKEILNGWVAAFILGNPIYSEDEFVLYNWKRNFGDKNDKVLHITDLRYGVCTNNPRKQWWYSGNLLDAEGDCERKDLSRAFLEWGTIVNASYPNIKRLDNRVFGDDNDLVRITSRGRDDGIFVGHSRLGYDKMLGDNYRMSSDDILQNTIESVIWKSGGLDVELLDISRSILGSDGFIRTYFECREKK